MRHILSLTAVELFMKRMDAIEPDDLETFRGLIFRRKNNEPVAYIVGSKEFYGLTFKVTRDTLIPRPDTETLVDIILEISGASPSGTLIDVCTGTGCIPISFKHHRKAWHVYGSDISKKALDVARTNDRDAGIEWRKGDLLAPFLDVDEVDFITANPPYIRRSEYENLDLDVLYEPELALRDDDPEGISFYQRLIPEALSILKVGGHLAMEIGYNQRRAIEQIGHGGYDLPYFIKDIAQNDRVVIFRKK